MVIGAGCAALNPLGFPSQLAREPRQALAAGGWKPIDQRDTSVLDPGIELIAFIGHGAPRVRRNEGPGADVGADRAGSGSVEILA